MRRNTRTGALVAVSLLAVLVASCGDDDGAADDTESSSPTSAGQTQAADNATIDACSLLDSVELTPLIGEVGGAGTGGGNATDVFSCTWNGLDGDLNTRATLEVKTNDSGEAGFAEFKDRASVEEAGDVGDESYVELGQASEDTDFTLNTLVARQGDSHLSLTAAGRLSGEDATSALAAALKAALTRLDAD